MQLEEGWKVNDERRYMGELTLLYHILPVQEREAQIDWPFLYNLRVKICVRRCLFVVGKESGIIAIQCFSNLGAVKCKMLKCRSANNLS